MFTFNKGPITASRSQADRTPRVVLTITQGARPALTLRERLSDLAMRFIAAPHSPATRNHLVLDTFPAALEGLTLSAQLRQAPQSATAPAKLLSGLSGLYNKGSRTLAYVNASVRCVSAADAIPTEPASSMKTWGLGSNKG
jgi:hypothetical protein